MFKSVAILAVAFLGLTFQSYSAHAADRDQSGWDIHANGHVELDTFYDSTRSYTEQLTGAAVQPTGTVAGDNGRTQMSIRQSRLYLKVNAPESGGWKTKGWFEGDFLGFDPAVANPGATAVSQTETAFYITPNFRLRNAYVTTENDSGWHILTGQAWSVFGYQPYFEILNTSGMTPINLIQRNPQIKVTKDLSVTNSIKGQVDVAVVRPVQRDSDIPNLDVGVRMNWDGRKSGLLHWASNQYTTEPTSIALSGTLRNFSTPNTDGNTADKQTYMGGGAALSGIIPILTTDGTSLKNSLTFVGEYVIGSGIVDNYFGFTGGLPAMTNGTAYTAGAGGNVAAGLVPNLDPGLAGYDSSGNFQLVQTQEYTAELQYILPTETVMAINLEYARVHSLNGLNLVSATTVAYDFNELLAVDFVYDFNPNFRVMAEYSRMSTHYGSGNFIGSNQYPSNNRYSVSTYFMF